MNEFWSSVRNSYSDAKTRLSIDGDKFTLRIDDRSSQDVYPAFCDIHVTVPDFEGKTFWLELRHPPLNAEVTEFLEDQDCEFRYTALCTIISLHLTVAIGSKVIKDLGRAIRRVTGRGQRYSDPNWKWICPRTSDSLVLFARALTEARSQRFPSRG
jgi:hypothetical protein